MGRLGVRGGLLLALPLLAAGCRPTFEPSGALYVDGAPFSPTSCLVIYCPATGVRLFDRTDATMDLTLSQERIDFMRDITGSPRIVLRREGRPEVSLGPCGSMTLTGQGYHGDGRRAARGELLLDCQGPARIEGELSWTGCF